jgi:hypothetical protein
MRSSPASRRRPRRPAARPRTRRTRPSPRHGPRADQATDTAARTKGLELLSQAERAYAAKSLGDAKTTARKATAAFRAGPGDPCDTARARLAEAREAERAAESDPSGGPRRGRATRSSPSPRRSSPSARCAEALAIVNRAAPWARSSEARSGRAWDAALVAIKEAERARDEARSRGASDIAVERGDIGLRRRASRTPERTSPTQPEPRARLVISTRRAGRPSCRPCSPPRPAPTSTSRLALEPSPRSTRPLPGTRPRTKRSSARSRPARTPRARARSTARPSPKPTR